MNLADIRWRIATATPPAVAHAVRTVGVGFVVTLCSWAVRGQLTTWDRVLGLPAFICTNCAAKAGLTRRPR